MTGNSQRVRDFINAWERRDLNDMLRRLTPDVFYHNVPMAPIEGVDAVRAFAEPFLAGCSDLAWTVHHIAETADGVVLTERTDRFLMAGVWLAIRVSGTFEFRDGLIARWRDYFDLAEFEAEMAKIRKE